MSSTPTRSPAPRSPRPRGTGTPSLADIPFRVLPLPLLRARAPRLGGAGLGGRGSMHLIERHARAYRHSWVVLVSGIFEPLFYLLSIGVGLGQLVGSVGGVSYAAYVAPALLATSSMNGAIYDSTFNVFFQIKYAKTYEAALATPMRAPDLALGQVLWALIRGAMYAFAFTGVMLAMGLFHSYWGICVLPAAVRFFHVALFDGTWSLAAYGIDTAVAMAFAAAGFRMTRARQMAQQYGFLGRAA